MSFNKFSIALLIIVLAVIVGLGEVWLRSPKAAKQSLIGTDVPVGTASLKLVPSKRAVTVGEQFSVDVIADTAGDATTGIDLVLRYDPVLLEPVDADATVAGVQVAPGTAFDFSPANVATLATGLINFSASQQPVSQPVKLTNGKIATLTFKAKAVGTAEVTFTHTPGASTDTNIVKANDSRDLLNTVENSSITISQ